MRIDCVSADIRAVKADMVVVNLFEGAKRPGGAAARVDAAIGGAIAAAVRDGDFAGKLGETLSLRPSKGLSSPRVLVVGLGKKEKFTADQARQAVLPVLKAAKRMKLATWRRSSTERAWAGSMRGPPRASAHSASPCRPSSTTGTRRRRRTASPGFFSSNGMRRRSPPCAPASPGAHGSARRSTGGVPSSRLLRPSCAPTTSRAPRGGWPAGSAPRRLERCASASSASRNSPPSRPADSRRGERESGAPPRLILAEYRGGAPGPRGPPSSEGVTFDTGGLSLRSGKG